MNYWIMINGQRMGPMTSEQLINMPGVTLKTPVWTQGMNDWVPLEQVPELAQLLPPIPPSYAPGMEVPGQSPAMPNTYLGWNIAATLLCCLVTGIVGIYYSSQVSPAYLQGDYERSLKMSKIAQNWLIASVIVGALGGILYGFIILFGIFNC